MQILYGAYIKGGIECIEKLLKKLEIYFYKHLILNDYSTQNFRVPTLKCRLWSGAMMEILKY